jgi:uncharacterized DUF497 family protein
VERTQASFESGPARAGFRFDYSEQRFVTLGLLGGIVVSIVHLENPLRIRVISMRKAKRHEQAIFYQAIQD